MAAAHSLHDVPGPVESVFETWLQGNALDDDVDDGDELDPLVLLPLADYLEAQASRLAAQGDPLASWLAARVRGLAETALHLHAETADQFDGRFAALEDARDARFYDRGFDEGLRKGVGLGG